ncbi:MAG TPA: DUF2490 domain-containing protein [Pyrinomonadaceae bacterium]
MNIRPRLIFPVVIACLFLDVTFASGQEPNGTAVWATFNNTVELRPQMQIQLSVDKREGEDFSYSHWNMRALISYRMKRLLSLKRSDIDEENHYNLVVGAGYQYLHTDENGKTENESRIIVEATPRYHPGADFLITDRNRIEFRWVEGVYGVRYRNKLVIDKPLKIQTIGFTVYASGEMFYDRSYHSWNQNRYAFGVQLPSKRRIMLDIYYLRKNCTTCNPNHTDVLGLTLNLYFRRGK